ncbi:hypothetical protein OPT61_g3935 [Boeremia exigua]|uniref:Uncharacterized protein n=1 Tax=Boeremia exigua TaxID=749465 RepID=A0ACC2IG61_9PLEO|nr:hypothetical protein OPT61_g3935 [Boeremia exigua]
MLSNSEEPIHNIEPRRKRPKQRSIDDMALETEKLMDYEFSWEKYCIDAIVPGPERTRLAKLPCIPNFGDIATLAEAARQSGLSKVLHGTREVSDKCLAKTVKALLGSICEDQCDEADVHRAAYCLGLEAIEEDSLGVDLLGVEEFKFDGFVASVPVTESLI